MSHVGVWGPDTYEMSKVRRRASAARSTRAVQNRSGRGFKNLSQSIDDAPILVDFGEPARKVRAGIDKRLGDWSPTSPAYEYARAQLRTVQEQHKALGLAGASPKAHERMLRVLREVLAQDSVFPTLSIDEDGEVLAEWRAAGFAVEIEVAESGAMSFSLRRQGAGTLNEGSSLSALRRLLRDFSAFVEAANPNWRSLFPAHPHHFG